MKPWLIIVLVAAAARISLTLMTTPVLSDDYWRYLHDGQVLAAGGNPYALAPADLPDADRRINHPHLITIYQPLSQYVFAGLTWAGVDLRLGFVAVDLAIVAVLLLALRQAGRSAWWAAVYAWHPLVIVEVAWSGHQDVIGILPLVGAVALTAGVPARPCPIAAGRTTLAGVLFALAVAVKPVAAPLALVLAARVGLRRTTLAVGACTATLVALYTPLALMPGGLSGMIETGRTFVAHWAFNGSIHALLQWSMPGGKPWADAACGVLLLGVLAWCVHRADDVVAATMTFLAAALLLSSTVHPWYLLWPLALVPLRPQAVLAPAVLIWSVTIGLSYAAHFSADFKPPVWVTVVAYVPVYAAVAWSVWRRGRHEGAPNDGGPLLGHADQ